MKWSARLGRIAGIDVRLHASFALICLWVAWLSWRDTGSLWGVLNGVTLVLLLFLCVLLHEFGHALTARRFGIGTRHITLWPIGGIALLEAIPDRPGQEVVIALAGPAVNLAIAAALALVAPLAGNGTAGGILQVLIHANLLLAGFNLLPAFPMDGGRVLRALLAMRFDRVRATRIAAIVGRVMAVGFLVAGLRGNPVLILIAGFVWFAAGAESRAVAAQTRRRAAAVPSSEGEANA
ncbi:MAG: site-2 protease family protein [Amaricoccus sp.]